MTKAFNTPDENKSYRKANALRGSGQTQLIDQSESLSHADAAVAFLDDHPIGTRFTVEAFDAWAEKKKLLIVPHESPKKSDAWLAHLQRRHQLRHNINMAASHPRMKDRDRDPFVIETIRAGSLEVRSPEDAIARSRIMRSILSLCGTKKRNLGYLMQSADWTALPPHEMLFAESLYDDLDAFQEQLEVSTRQLERKFQKLMAKIDRAIKAGQIVPKAHALERLTAQELFPVDPDLDDDDEPLAPSAGQE